MKAIHSLYRPRVILYNLSFGSLSQLLTLSPDRGESPRLPELIILIHEREEMFRYRLHVFKNQSVYRLYMEDSHMLQ